MRILSIDTTTDACSVALKLDNEKISAFKLCPRKNTQFILPMIDNLLKKGKIELSEIDILAFGRGPGSFTGVRISTSIAQGLAMGVNIPLVGISNLAALAVGAFRKNQSKRVLLAVEAYMGEIYWAEYQRHHNGVWYGENTEAILKPEAVIKRLNQLDGVWTTVGTGWQRLPVMISDSPIVLEKSDHIFSDAQDLLPLALQAISQQKTIKAEQATPVYLRNESAWKK